MVSNMLVEEAALPAEADRKCTEDLMPMADGTELFYRTWTPKSVDSGGRQRAVLLFHRGHEHSGRLLDVVDRLGLDDHWVFAWDARGHGNSPGPRGYADGVGQLAADVDQFVRGIAERYHIELANMSVVAHSIGAVVVATWVHDYAPPVRCMVLVAPAFRVKLYVPLAIPGLRLVHKIRPQASVTSYVRPTMLTHDPAAAAAYAADPLVSSGVSVELLLELHDTSTRLLADAGAIPTPTLVLTAGSDWVVRTGPQQQFVDGLSSARKQLIQYPGTYHDLWHETCAPQVLGDLRDFIEQQYEEPPALPSLVDAHKRGASFDRWRELAAPLPGWHPRQMYYTGMRTTLGTLGQLSDGIRLGWESGFNSGRTLDYVYENQARGRTPLGRWADCSYLSSPGWSGIRVRRTHMDQTLDQAIRQLAASRGVDNPPIHIVDVAAGAGRYVLDALERHPGGNLTATLCDQDAKGLEVGRAAAIERGIERAEFLQADAFDEQSLAEFSPRADIAIVSGLFELFADNQPVRRTLAGLSRAVRPGGYLIYTNQPWHPQQELIARALHGFDGKLWAMRCRSTAEMDQLVEAAGFVKREMKIDRWGIFTVSLAQMPS